MDSWTDVSLTVPTASYGVVTMHCTEDYSKNCTNDDNGYNSCDEIDSVCYNYMLPTGSFLIVFTKFTDTLCFEHLLCIQYSRQIAQRLLLCLQQQLY